MKFLLHNFEQRELSEVVDVAPVTLASSPEEEAYRVLGFFDEGGILRPVSHEISHGILKARYSPLLPAEDVGHFISYCVTNTEGIRFCREYYRHQSGGVRSFWVLEMVVESCSTSHTDSVIKSLIRYRPPVKEVTPAPQPSAPARQQSSNIKVMQNHQQPAVDSGIKMGVDRYGKPFIASMPLPHAEVFDEFALNRENPIIVSDANGSGRRPRTSRG